MYRQRSGHLIGAICVATLLFSSCTVSNLFTLNGQVEGLRDGDSVFLLVRTLSSISTQKEDISPRFGDTLATIARGGSFIFTGHVEGIRDARLVFQRLAPRSPSASLFLEPGTISFTGHLDDIHDATITGTPNNDVATAFRKNEQDRYAGLLPIQRRLRDTTLSEQELVELQREAARIRAQIRQSRIDFIREYPDAYAAPTYLRLLEDNLDIDTLEQLYSNLSEDVKQSRFARGTAAKIEARRRTAIGQPAPLFSAFSHEGETVSLEDYRGKYVLIDFWASWCVPCRAEHPHLRRAYAHYKDFGFDILGVSLDDDRDRWIDAIEADSLIWKNVSEVNGFANSIARLYGVQPIPDNFLVDPDGRIVARRLRGDEVESTLARLIKERTVN